MSKRNKTASTALVVIENAANTVAPVVKTDAELLAALDAAEIEQMVSEGAPDLVTEAIQTEVLEQPTAEVIEDVVNQLDAQDAALENSDTGPAIGEPDTDPAPAVDDQAKDAADEEPTLRDILDFVSEEETQVMHERISDAFDARVSFERTKNAANESIQETLKKSRQVLDRSIVASLFVATAVDPDFINGSRSAGSGYNVYAIGKVADLVSCLNTGIMRNAINNAVCRSLFRFRAAKEVFTGEMARAAASDKLRVQGRIKDLLVRHTVSASTAPTQASSTCAALQTLGIVKNVGSMKSPVYELIDSAQTRALAEALKEPYAIAA